jgi:hypothetical protein
MNEIIASVIQAKGADADSRTSMLPTLLQQVWFATLVAWSAGILSQAEVNTHMDQAIELVMASPKLKGARTASVKHVSL